MLLFTTLAVIVAVRCPSTLVTCTGEVTSATLASWLIGTIPEGAGTGSLRSTAATAPGIGGTAMSPTVSWAGRTPCAVGTLPSGKPSRTSVVYCVSVAGLDTGGRGLGLVDLDDDGRTTLTEVRGHVGQAVHGLDRLEDRRVGRLEDGRVGGRDLDLDRRAAAPSRRPRRSP